MEHKIELGDEIKTSDQPGTVTPATLPLKTYEVLAESGLFKNGKQYNKGEQIQLSEKTAANFLAINEIKEVTQ